MIADASITQQGKHQCSLTLDLEGFAERLTSILGTSVEPQEALYLFHERFNVGRFLVFLDYDRRFLGLGGYHPLINVGVLTWHRLQEALLWGNLHKRDLEALVDLGWRWLSVQKRLEESGWFVIYNLERCLCRQGNTWKPYLIQERSSLGRMLEAKMVEKPEILVVHLPLSKAFWASERQGFFLQRGELVGLTKSPYQLLESLGPRRAILEILELLEA